MTHLRTRLFSALCPERALTWCVAQAARCPWSWFKNRLINTFARRYHISMDEALFSEASAYPTFQDFFSRALKPGARTVAPGACLNAPCDGTVSALGFLRQGILLQAKGQSYALSALLGERSHTWPDGTPYMTAYLSPGDYHRVHAPCAARLVRSRFIPGRLCSVQPAAQEAIPGLYANNERLVLFFDTKHGPMVVVMVGALIVGQLWTTWSGALREKKVSTWEHDLAFERGAELGRFLMGSTVITLGPQNLIWDPALQVGNTLKLGQDLGAMPDPKETPTPQ